MLSSVSSKKHLRPIIGISLDSIDPDSEINRDGNFQYSRYPWYALKGHYVSAVIKAGGIPLMLASEPDCILEYLDIIDGLVIPGACFDVDPKLYGEEISHPSVLVNHKRTNFEWALLRAALDRDTPTLGICGGHQLLNVLMGGSLVQHMPVHAPSDIDHKPAIAPSEAAHHVDIIPQTKLSAIVATPTLHVNSVHHQCIKELGQNLIVNARAHDNVIEGIESANHRFVLGIQWHPELNVSEGDAAIFKNLVQISAEQY